ncbi:MAG: DUF1016 domain-containing protein [Bacilli bacterium]|nr:DUF1016 domain-containing protein [Bacilli bacterium]
MNYYNEIKDILIKNEVYKKAKDYSKNKSDLNSYYEVGRLLVEAQGGEERAKYGNKLIKEYSEKLTKELGKKYSTTNLKYMKQFYLMIQKGHAMRDQLTWTHYRCLLSIKEDKKIDYYINIAANQNISYRELQERIKSNEYERIGYKDELEEPKVNTLIKNPVLIKTKHIPDKVTEYALHNLILENMDNFLKELGEGFAYIGHEVKIKIGDNNHSIDFLLFNYKFNCFVVVEIKTTEFKAEHIGQIKKYINYVDENIKELYNDKTVGIVICRDINGYVLKYCTDERIFTTTYELNTN